MMNGTQKRILSLLLAAVMLLALVACAQKEGTAVREEAVTPGAEPAAQKDEKKEDVTLVYWCMWEAGETQGVAIRAAADAFTEETGIKVQIEFKGRDGNIQGLQPALDAKTEIDIFDGYVDRINDVWGNYTLDLEELFEKYGMQSLTRPAFIEWTRNSGNGVLKGIPYQASVAAWCYNKDIFAAAGVTETPKTWDEFVTACEKIRAAGYDPICDDTDYLGYMYGYAFARLAGQDVAEKVYFDGTWKECPEALEAARLFEELAQKNCFSPNIAASPWPNAQNTELGGGKAAMQFCGSWLPNEIRGVTGDDFNWGGFAFPDVGGVNGTEANNTTYQALAINKASKHPDEAFQFIKWITTGKYDQMIAKDSWSISADPANDDIHPSQIDFKNICDTTTIRYDEGGGAYNNGDITSDLLDNVGRLCGGTLSAEEFIDAMAVIY